jgi:hypothetical protein
MNRLLKKMELLPLYGIYFTIFFSAGYGKLSNKGQVPAWFRDKFSGTFLNLFPRALSLEFHFIALLEMAVCGVLLYSFLKKEFLPAKKRRYLQLALLMAAVTFVVLELGLVAISDFTGAFQIFVYFSLTWILLQSVDRGGVSPIV